MGRRWKYTPPSHEKDPLEYKAYIASWLAVPPSEVTPAAIDLCTLVESLDEVGRERLWRRLCSKFHIRKVDALEIIDSCVRRGWIAYCDPQGNGYNPIVVSTETFYLWRKKHNVQLPKNSTRRVFKH